MILTATPILVNSTVKPSTLNNGFIDPFIQVTKDSQSKWFQQPLQTAKLLDGYPNFFFDSEVVDVMSNPLHIDIISINNSTLPHFLVLDGDRVNEFTVGTEFIIFGSKLNTGNYTVAKVDLINNQTQVTVNGTISSADLTGKVILKNIKRIKLTKPSDAVIIKFDTTIDIPEKRTCKILPNFTGTNVINTVTDVSCPGQIPFTYVPNTSSIEVFINGKQLSNSFIQELSLEEVGFFIKPIGDIFNVNSSGNSFFTLLGNRVNDLPIGIKFTVSASSFVANNGEYTVLNSVYDNVLDLTTVNVNPTPGVTANTGQIHVNSISIDSVDGINNIFFFSGDTTDIFAVTNTFKVAGSTSTIIDGTYTISLVSYDSISNLTSVTVLETIPTPIPSLLGKAFDIQALIVVVKSSGIMRETQDPSQPLEYKFINFSIIEFEKNITYDLLGNVDIFLLNPSREKNSPLTLIDNLSNVVVDNVNLWDPARGHNYPPALKVIDIFNEKDPAVYNNVINDNYDEITLVKNQFNNSFPLADDIASDDVANKVRRWGSEQVGTIWWDTKHLDYIPYYDSLVFPTLVNRNFRWGQVAEYSDVNLYKWVSSPVPPEQWDTYVASLVSDLSIASEDKPSGTVKQTLYKRTRDAATAGFQDLVLGKASLAEVDFTGTSVLLNNYWTIDTPTESFYVWYNFFGSSVDPLVFGKTAIEVLIPTIPLPAVFGEELASATNDALNATSQFMSEIDTSNIEKLIILNVIDGLSPSPVDVTTGVTVTVIEPGVNSIQTGSDDSGLLQNFEYIINVRVDEEDDSQEITITTGLQSPVRYQEIVGLLNQGLNGATADIIDGYLRITSDLIGPSSIIEFEDTKTHLFTELDNFLEITDSVQGIEAIPPAVATSGYQDIKFSIPKNLLDLSGLEAYVTYTFGIDVNNQGAIEDIELVFLTDPTIDDLVKALDLNLNNATATFIDGTDFIRITSATVGSVSTIKLIQTPVNLITALNSIPSQPFFGSTVGDWTDYSIEEDKLLEFDVAFLSEQRVFDTSTLVNINDDTEDEPFVTLYINGIRNADYFVTAENTIILPDILSDKDHIALVHHADVPTAIELEFDPDIEDDLLILTHYKNFSNYSTVVTLNEFGVGDVDTTTYYFWVRNSVNRINDGLSLLRAQEQLKNNPDPYMHIQNSLLLKTETNSNGQDVIIPNRFNQVIVHGLQGIVTESERYILRLVKDLSLRDQLGCVESSPIEKNVHTEWALIREKQSDLIVRDLWDKITESILGHKLDNVSINVPTLDRVLYDELNDTDTQYGLQDGQSITSKAIAIDTITRLVTDPDFDIFPSSKSDFLENVFDLTTDSASIIATMNGMYSGFGTEAVNRIFFTVLMDGFVVKNEMTDIFKTSWLSLQNTVQFDVNGTLSNG